MNDELQSVLDAYAKAESLQDYPGRYFPALNAAENRMAAWGAKNPEQLRVEAAARNIPRWILEENGWGDLWANDPEPSYVNDPGSHYNRARTWTD